MALKIAHLPCVRELSDFDFRAQPIQVLAARGPRGLSLGKVRTHGKNETRNNSELKNSIAAEGGTENGSYLDEHSFSDKDYPFLRTEEVQRSVIFAQQRHIPNQFKTKDLMVRV